MSWSEEYSKENKPDKDKISEYINCKYWDNLCEFLENTYFISPIIEHSTCSGASGWNVKYRKGSKAICTLYPAKEYFTCLVSIGSKIASEAELVISSCEYIKELYENTKLYNGSRWLMIDVKSDEILEILKQLFFIRVSPPKKGGK